jgi:DNA polymerase III sliding clamp (beta) subunit (PCNA family)
MKGINDMNESKQFIEAILNLQRIVDPKNIRLAFTGVYVAPIDNNQLKLIACNSYSLAERIVPCPEGFDLKLPFIIRGDSLKLLKSFYALNKKASFRIEFNHESDSIEIIEESDKNSVLLQRVNAEYPDTDRVKPTRLNFKFALNPELLLELCEALRQDKKQPNMAILELNSNDNLNPIKITFQGNSGVLMPMKINE